MRFTLKGMLPGALCRNGGGGILKDGKLWLLKMLLFAADFGVDERELLIPLFD